MMKNKTKTRKLDLPDKTILYLIHNNLCYVTLTPKGNKMLMSYAKRLEKILNKK